MSSFCLGSSRHCLSQTVRAKELTFWENVHPPLCITCHLSCVMYNTFFLLLLWQSGWASQWRVCYQRGVSCIVSMLLGYFKQKKINNKNTRILNWRHPKVSTNNLLSIQSYKNCSSQQKNSLLYLILRRLFHVKVLGWNRS